MTDQELIQQRRHKWRLDGRPVRTLEDAREFIEEAGFCLMYPQSAQQASGGVGGGVGRHALLVPTFIGAYAGNDDHLPTVQHAFADPRAQQATDLMVRLLREKSTFEANLFGENVFLVSAGIFPYFFGLVGDRNPRQLPKPGSRSDYSPLARDIFEVIQRDGALSKPKLRERLGSELTPAALDRALGELWSRLRITRVDYKEGEGAFWDVLLRWAPEAVRQGIEVSVPEALSALMSKYLDCVVAAERSEIGDFFSHFVARSKVNEAVNALLGARELMFIPVGNSSKIQVAPPRGQAVTPHPRRRG
ncbi:MAG: DNA glycosylase AlkZ-like family protein [Terriglobales bacterium]